MPRLRELELKLRRKRFALFVSLCSALRCSSKPLRILDVGGTWAYWSAMDWRRLDAVDITLLNLFEETSLPPGFASVIGSACDLSCYADHAFDIVYSNSVLGVVGGRKDQQRMADEIRRVGRAYFVQTPNRHFVIDWRTLVPFFHFVPVGVQAWCLRQMPVGRYRRVPSYEASVAMASRIQDLSMADVTALFPGATIVRERIFGLTKSFLIHSGFRGTPRCVATLV